MNWQNVNSDSTWASIDNWYWRTLEVCIGVITASIPALRPGYKAVSAIVRSYLSRRSSGNYSTFGLTKAGNPLYARSDEGPIAQYSANSAKQPSGPREAARHAASAEIDQAMQYGAGEEHFAMNSLPWDKSTMKHDIKKTTRVDVDIERQRNPEPDDIDAWIRGGRYFV